MLLCWGQPSRRCFARIIPNGSGKTRSVVSRIGGRELDAFNGNVVKNLVIHSATLPRTKSSNLAKKAGVIRKQTDELRRFIPQPIFGKAKATLIKTKEMKFDSLFEINKFMIDDLPRCTTGNIADLMHISVKLTKKSKKISLLKNHLPLIASRLKEFPPSDWRFRDISTVVYGLQSFTENDEGVSSILSVMTELALQNISSKQPIKSQDISMMLLGLQCMSSRNEEIKKLLSAITTMISTCEESFDEQNIGNALHGLQSMNSDCTVVTLLLSALTIKIRDSESEISSQAVSNSLLGLQNMNSDSGEIRILISAIASKIRNCKPELSAVALSNSFYGLQGMSSDRAEVKDLLSALTVKAHHSVRRLNSNEISNAMFGLQRMRNDSVEVRDAVAVLAIKLKYSGAELSGHAVCSSLYGLQGMTSECTETRTLLSVLTTTLIGSKDRLSANDISNALYGLQDLREMIPKDAYLSTLRILYENVNRILYGDDGIIPVLDNIILNNLISLTESTALILPQLNKVLKQNVYPQPSTLNSKL